MKSILLLPLFITVAVVAQEPDNGSSLYKMREAELNFARASVMYGRNASFVSNFAEVSVIFTDKWITNGRQFWKERKVQPVVLKWEPEFMDISDSRDFGISTGPWEAQEFRPNTGPVSTGYYLTVWKLDADNIWRVILDAGSGTPPPSGPKHAFSFPAGADKAFTGNPKSDLQSSEKDLLDREQQFTSAWKKSPTASSYLSFLSPNARMQLNGHLPSANRDTINSWIGHLEKTLSWKPAGSGIASSGDLGFTYGMLERSGNSTEPKGHYVRIWRKPPEGNWTIVLEMINFD